MRAQQETRHYTCAVREGRAATEGNKKKERKNC